MWWKSYKSRINKKVLFEILDDSFNNEEKLVVETKAEQKTILLELQKHIESRNIEKKRTWNDRFYILENSLSVTGQIIGRTVLEHYNIRDNFIMRNYLIVQIKESTHTKQQLYMAIFFKDEILNIEFPIHKYGFNDEKLEQLTVRFDKYQTTKQDIIQFIDTLVSKQKELEQEQKNTKLKKQKVTVLKSKTIISKVKEIMKEKKMVYRFEEKRDKIILIVKLKKSKVIEITITYKKFQSALQNLSELIDKLVELYEHGIEVKHKQTNNIDYYDWIKN